VVIDNKGSSVIKTELLQWSGISPVLKVVVVCCGNFSSTIFYNFSAHMYVTSEGKCSGSCDIVKLSEITDNTLVAVQGRDICS